MKTVSTFYRDLVPGDVILWLGALERVEHVYVLDLSCYCNGQFSGENQVFFSLSPVNDFSLQVLGFLRANGVYDGPESRQVQRVIYDEES